MASVVGNKFVALLAFDSLYDAEVGLKELRGLK